LCSVALNIHHLQLALVQLSNVNVIKKPLSGLKNVLQKPHEAFKGFGSGLTEVHIKLDAGTFLDFATHLGQNETRSQKSTHVHSTVSHGRLMQ
jgi:hypothetical protein